MFPETMTHIGIVAGGSITIIGALWLMIREFVKDTSKRERAMTAALASMHEWQRGTMQGMIQENTAALAVHSESMRAATKATEELKREIHSLRMESLERERKRTGRVGDSESGLNLGET